MENIDFNLLSPLILLAVAPVATLMVIAIYRNHTVTFCLAVILLVLFLIDCFRLWSLSFDNQMVDDLLMIDKFGLFFMILIAIGGILILFISYSYLNNNVKVAEEFYVLFLTALVGAVVLVSSIHFATLFLGLEILSISLYAMIAYTREWKNSIEGGLKYLILAAGSSAFLLFGMGLIYLQTGALDFEAIGSSLEKVNLISTAGLAMMLVGIGFKLGLVPFHIWTPDIYQGAPAPVTALIASVSKGSMVVVLVRFLHTTNSQQFAWIIWTFSAMAIASMLIGSLLALKQSNLKRLLAYSSIAHLGYLLVAIIAGSDFSVEAVTYYLVAYFISIIGAFGILSIFNSTGEIEQVSDLQGMFWTRPWLSVIFGVMFFSLVGIPLTAGFIGKFYVVMAAVNSGLWALAITLVVSSAIGLYYYLRVIKTMLTPVAKDAPKSALGQLSTMGLVVMSILGLLVIWFGVFPSQLIAVIRSIEVL
ncbi:MAG: NADH-quinone oxidoreductase subunit N [Cyclobacteriaceae bacterium]|nr:MAG: NADH-quinone oxidoreductase subunit N [Cyclobacteriaceae bacterium]